MASSAEDCDHRCDADLSCGRAVEEGDPAVWQLVLAAWAAYREWVGKVLGLCGLLAECISAEQVCV